MRTIMPQTASSLAALVLGVEILFQIAACRPAAEAERKVEREQVKQAISDLAVRHNAVTVDWHRGSAQEDILKDFYTIEVEKRLVRDDDRPTLFLASVEDIEKQGTKYFVRLRTPLVDPAMPEILFVLESDAVQAKRLIDQPTTWLDQYAVVASVSSVQKAMFAVKAHPISSEEAEITVEPSKVFVARGRCLEMLFVGDYGIGAELE